MSNHAMHMGEIRTALLAMREAARPVVDFLWLLESDEELLPLDDGEPVAVYAGRGRSVTVNVGDLRRLRAAYKAAAVMRFDETLA